MALVRERTIPTERPPPVGEGSANFCGKRGITWSAQRVPTAVNLCFLDRSRYFFIQVAPQLTSRGWVDPVPDPLLLKKSGSAGNRTRDLCICSQKLWPLDHRGGLHFRLIQFWMWKSAYVGVYQLLNWKMQGGTLKFGLGIVQGNNYTFNLTDKKKSTENPTQYSSHLTFHTKPTSMTSWLPSNICLPTTGFSAAEHVRVTKFRFCTSVRIWTVKAAFGETLNCVEGECNKILIWERGEFGNTLAAYWGWV